MAKTKLERLQSKQAAIKSQLKKVEEEISSEILNQLKDFTGPFMDPEWAVVRIDRPNGKASTNVTYYFLNQRENIDCIILTDWDGDIKIRKQFWERLNQEQKKMVDAEIKAKYPHLSEVTIQNAYIGW